MIQINLAKKSFVLLAIFGVLISCNPNEKSADKCNNNRSFDTVAFLKALPNLKEYPTEFVENAKMISVDEYFSASQAELFNQTNWIAMMYDSTTQQYSLRKLYSNKNFESTIDVSADGKVGYRFVDIAREKQKTLFLFDNPWMKQEKDQLKNIISGEMSLEGGKKFEFTMGGKKYELQADDKQLIVDDRQGSFDYHLFLNELNNNQISNTIQLSYIPWFDDSQVEILFIGDLDGDQKPDIILDNSYKYTGSGISGILYLSSAAPKKLVKPISKEQTGELRGEEMHSEGC